MSEEPTTSDRVDRVRGILAAANRGDFDAVISFFAPGAVWESRMAGVTFEGRATIRARIEDWLGVFENLWFELEEIVDLGNGVVFAVVRQDDRPVGSAARIGAPEAWVVVWGGNRILRVTTYAKIDEGRAAAERLAKSRR